MQTLVDNFESHLTGGLSVWCINDRSVWCFLGWLTCYVVHLCATETGVCAPKLKIQRAIVLCGWNLSSVNELVLLVSVTSLMDSSEKDMACVIYPRKPFYITICIITEWGMDLLPVILQHRCFTINHTTAVSIIWYFCSIDPHLVPS